MPESRPSTIVVVRHAESQANFSLSQIDEGLLPNFPSELTSLRDADVRLTERGVAQARATGPYLAARFAPFDYCYVSPWTRTRQTFEHLLEGFPADQRVRLARSTSYDDRLREHEPGALLWLTPAEVAARYPDEARRRAIEGEYFYRPIGGESWADVGMRLAGMLGTLYRDHPGGHVLIVTHSTVILVLRRLLQYLSEEEILAVRKQGNARNASITVFTHGAGAAGAGLANETDAAGASPAEEADADGPGGRAGTAEDVNVHPLNHWRLELWDYLAYGPELTSMVPDNQQRRTHPDALTP
jgi:probable phosphoglycerate mutase